MMYVMNLLASALRAVAQRLDGVEMVEIKHNHVHTDIHVYTMADTDPNDIAKQIKFHMKLHG